MRWRRNRIVSAMARMYRVRIIFRFVSKAATGRQQGAPRCPQAGPFSPSGLCRAGVPPFFACICPENPPPAGFAGSAADKRPAAAAPKGRCGFGYPLAGAPAQGARIFRPPGDAAQVRLSPPCPPISRTKKQRAGMSRTYAHRYTLFINIAQGNQKKQDPPEKNLIGCCILGRRPRPKSHLPRKRAAARFGERQRAAGIFGAWGACFVSAERAGCTPSPSGIRRPGLQLRQGPRAIPLSSMACNSGLLGKRKAAGSPLREPAALFRINRIAEPLLTAS